MADLYNSVGIIDEEIIAAITRLTDRKKKISAEEYHTYLLEIVGDELLAKKITHIVEDQSGTNKVLEGVRSLGIDNIRIDRTIARGFNYYTSTVFEIVDCDPTNNRSMLGGGRYDNLTTMFSGDAISGIGFGMGDVTMRDFLETHALIPAHIRSTAPHVMVIPMETEQNLFAEQVAMHIRKAGHKVATDIGTRKVGKKIGSASDKGCRFVIVIGEQEMKTDSLTIKNLLSGEERINTLSALMNFLNEA